MTREDLAGRPGSVSGEASGRDAVFTFSAETWSDAYRRGMMRPPERILATLESSERVRRLLVVNPWRKRATAYGRRIMGLTTRFPEDARRRLHSPLRSAKDDPSDIPGLEASYRDYDTGVAIAAAAFGLDRPAVITTNPFVAAFAPLGWAGGITYFGRDDWASWPARGRYRDAYLEAYRRMSERGVAVTAVSAQIIERIAPAGPSAVVPNGIDPAEWLGEAEPPPAWFARLPAPRAVYVGTIDSRLDLEGVAMLAKRRPDLTVVLLGPIPNPSILSVVRDLPNVVVHGTVPRRQLTAVLRAADVGLLAHRRTELTEAMSPLKVYEYLAAGLPVIATDLPPVRGLGDRVLLVDEVAGAADVVDRALALGPEGEAARVAFVEANSWASRHEALLELAFGR